MGPAVAIVASLLALVDDRGIPPTKLLFYFRLLALSSLIPFENLILVFQNTIVVIHGFQHVVWKGNNKKKVKVKLREKLIQHL